MGNSLYLSSSLYACFNNAIDLAVKYGAFESKPCVLITLANKVGINKVSSVDLGIDAAIKLARLRKFLVLSLFCKEIAAAAPGALICSKELGLYTNL